MDGVFIGHSQGVKIITGFLSGNFMYRSTHVCRRDMREYVAVKIQGWWTSPQNNRLSALEEISIVVVISSRNLDFICGIYPVTVHIDWRREMMDSCLI